MASPGDDQEIGNADVPPFGEADARLATGGLSWSWDLDLSAGGEADARLATGGLSWSWDLDLSAVVEALTGQAPWLRTADDDDDDRAAAYAARAETAPADDRAADAD